MQIYLFLREEMSLYHSSNLPYTHEIRENLTKWINCFLLSFSLLGGEEVT